MSTAQDFVVSYHTTPRRKLTKEGKLKAQELYEKQKDADSKPVTGMFKNLEDTGGSFSFMYKKYKGDPHQRYTLKDGQTYTIPLGVAKHINSLKKVERDYAKDAQGVKTLKTYVSGSTQRVQFLSKDYM